MDGVTVTLYPENRSFPEKKVIILSQPLSIGRGTPDGNPANLKFDSRVISRNHAKLTHEAGKFYIQDTKSSSGTFVNGERLSGQGQESKLFELHDGDQIRLGEDFSDATTYIPAITFRVKLPGGKERGEEEANQQDEYKIEDFVDTRNDPDLNKTVEDEFNTIWNSLVADINSPLKRLREAKKTGQVLFKSAKEDESENTSPDSETIKTIAIKDTKDTKQSSPLKPDTELTGELVTMIDNLQWESPEVKQVVLNLAKQQDQQLLTFFKTLKSFPGSFLNIATKYAKFTQNK